MSHEMIRTDAENGVWESMSCARKIVLTGDNYKVLNDDGCPEAHFGTTEPDLTMNLHVEQGD